MQFAIVEGKPVQAGKDAPEEGRCPYCNMTLVLTGSSADQSSWRYPSPEKIGYGYKHISKMAESDCRHQRTQAQAELDQALRIEA